MDVVVQGEPFRGQFVDASAFSPYPEVLPVRCHAIHEVAVQQRIYLFGYVVAYLLEIVFQRVVYI